MPTRYIFAVLGCAFLIAATLRLVRERWQIRPASKTWLIVGAIFVLVSLLI